MSAKIEITYTGGVPYGAAMPRSVYNRLRREALVDVGNYWHDHFRAQHFQATAYTRYGYTPRTKKYEMRKTKTLHHRRPLVFTGESEMRSRVRKFVTTAAGTKATLKIVLNMPTLNRPGKRGKDGKTVDMRAEMTTVTDEEMRELARVYHDSLVARIAAYRGTKRVTILAA